MINKSIYIILCENRGELIFCKHLKYLLRHFSGTRGIDMKIYCAKRQNVYLIHNHIAKWPGLFPELNMGIQLAKLGLGEDHLNSIVCPYPKHWEYSIQPQRKELKMLYKAAEGAQLVGFKQRKETIKSNNT